MFNHLKIFHDISHEPMYLLVNTSATLGLLGVDVIPGRPMLNSPLSIFILAKLDTTLEPIPWSSLSVLLVPK